MRSQNDGHHKMEDKRAKVERAHSKVCEALKELNGTTDSSELFILKMKLQQIERELFLCLEVKK